MKSRYYLFLIPILFLAGCQSNRPTVSSTFPLPSSEPTLATSPVTTPTSFFQNSIPAITASPSTVPEAATTLAPATSSAPTTPLSRLPAGVPLKISSIQMFPDGIGWALGGESDSPAHVLYTQDDGKTWADLTPPEPAPLPGSPEKTAIAFFLDPQHAWVTFGPPDPQVTDQPVVWRTEDSGTTWKASQVLQGVAIDPVYQPFLFFFSDLQHGWLMSHHGAAAGHTPVSIYQTVDSGQTWTIVARPMEDVSSPLHTCCQSGMVFFDDNLTGLVARDGGPIPTPHILRTTDGGVTWEQHDLFEVVKGLYTNNYCTTSSLQRFAGDSAAVVMNCMGNDPNGPHQAYQFITQDRGASWNWQPLPEPAWPAEWSNVRSISSVQWLDINTRWLFIQAYYELPGSTDGHNATQIYRTQDGGKNWVPVGITYWSGQFSYINATNGYAVARSGQETAFVSTQNGGQSWTMQEPILVK